MPGQARADQLAASTGDAHLPPRRQQVDEAFVSVEIERGIGAGAPDAFSALWSLETAAGSVSGVAEGEARFVVDRWELRGLSVAKSGSWLRSLYGDRPEASADIATGTSVAGLADSGYGAGGFMASIGVNDAGSDDDTITWQVDAYMNAAS